MTLKRTDPYAVLGLNPQATQEEIRRAYRALMRQNHPDTRVRGGDPTDHDPTGNDPTGNDPTDNAASDATLQQVIAAYAILGDPASRAEYDHRTSAQHPRAAPWGDPGRWGGPGMRSSSGAPDQPPIQAGPVRWHRCSG